MSQTALGLVRAGFGKLQRSSDAEPEHHSYNWVPNQINNNATKKKNTKEGGHCANVKKKIIQEQ